MSQPLLLFYLTLLFFVGAIRSNGINRQLLRMAFQTIDYKVVLSKVCLLEFMKNATYEGIGGTTYLIEMVEGFLDSFVYPILENTPAVNSAIGRYHWEIIRRREMQIGQALAEISGISTEEAIRLAEAKGMQEPLREFDEQDVHIWVTAIQENCSFIVTNNTKRFPKTIGETQRIKPGDFYNLIIND